jgi:cytochrome c biogenesis protein CcdA
MRLSDELLTAGAAVVNSQKLTVATSAATIGLGISSWLELIRGPASVLAIIAGIMVSFSLYRRNMIAAEIDSLTLEQRRREEAQFKQAFMAGTADARKDDPK